MAIIWGAYAARPLRSLRNISLMVAIAATVFYFAAIMPAFNFYYTAAGSGARFGRMASLPWPVETTQKALQRLRTTRAVHATVWDNGTAAVTGAKGPIAGVECKSVGQTTGDLCDLTFYSRRLTVSGDTRATDEGVVLDTALARRAGVSPGDTVRVEWDMRGLSAAPPVTARVVRLVRPTAETSGVLFVGEPPRAPRLGVNVFMAEETAAGKLDGAFAPDVEFIGRDQAVDGGRAKFEEVLSRNTRYTLIWISLAAYGGFQLWDQLDRVRDRRKRYAVLVSMGLEEARIVRALRWEQLVLSLLTAPLGCALGAWLLGVTARLYLPVDSLIAVAIYAIGVNLVAAGIVGHRLRGELRRLPVATLLAEV